MKTIRLMLALCTVWPALAHAQATQRGASPVPHHDLSLAVRAQLVASHVPESVKPPVAVAEKMLLLVDLEALAMANNPTIRRASARVEAARGQWVQVGLPPNPVVGYSASEIGNEGRAGQQGAFVGKEFVTAGKLGLNRAAAAQEISQAEQELKAQRLRVLNDVRLAFFDVLVAQQRVQITLTLVRIGQQSLETADLLLKGAEGSRVDQLQARVEANTAKIVAANASNEYTGAWRRLAALAGIPDVQPTAITGDLHDGLDAISYHGARERLLEESPELFSAQANVRRNEALLARARAEPIPNLDVQAMLQHDNATHYDIAGVQVGVPLPFFNQNQGGIRRAQAELAIAQMEVGRVELDLQHRLASAYQRYGSAKQQIDIYTKDILPDAKTTLDLVSAGYQQGEFSFLTLLTAQRTYFQTNLAYLDALRQLRESTIAIDGLLLSDSLSAQERGR